MQNLLLTLKRFYLIQSFKETQKLVFFQNFFKTYSGGCFFFGKVEEILVVSKIWVAQVFAA